MREGNCVLDILHNFFKTFLLIHLYHVTFQNSQKILIVGGLELWYFRSCKRCPNSEDIEDCFRESFNELNINEIQYKVWTSTDRCTIVDVTSDIDKFIDTFVTNLDKLLKHDFMLKMKSIFSNTKLN